MSATQILTIAAAIANNQQVKLPAMSKKDFDKLLMTIKAAK
ncbi:hypothetical protein [Motilimonas pumila]|nr:hypothetical protein [Motilimonas pumila]